MPAAKRKPKTTLPSRKINTRAANASKRAARTAAKAAKPPEGDHIRTWASKDAVVKFVHECLAAKSRTSVIGQEKSSASKKATENGVDVPAAMIGARIIGKAKMDGLKGRLLWDNLKYYVEDCMEFDKIAPATLFASEEMRSTKSARKAKGPEQTELPVGEAESEMTTYAQPEPMPGDVGPTMQ